MSAHEIHAYSRIPLVAARGEGSWLFDEDGTAYLDLYGGHAVAILGHCPPAVSGAIARQAGTLLFCSNAVELRVRDAAVERLARIAPWEDARVLLLNSGTEAIETALKIARQATGRTRVVGFHGGFHGRTLGALAACGLPSYRKQAEFLGDCFRVSPWGSVEDIDDTCAAVVVEPIQSMGGVRALGPDFTRDLRARCDAAGALLVFDEVQTAPARTGTWFWGDAAADLVATAKGIGGGFPVSAVLARPEVAAVVRPGDQGTTFGGGPLACAAVDATLAELERIDAPARARRIEARVREGLPGVEIRGRGGLLGLVRDDAAGALSRLRTEHRVLAGSCPGDSRVMRLFPPLTLSDSELETALDALRSVLS